jgi:predicted CoA-substrate-specific enzyme activase
MAQLTTPITCGIDSGSRTTKLVLLQGEEILHAAVETTGINPAITAEKLLNEACVARDISRADIAMLYSTGYGRNILPFSQKVISEISCHARGVHLLFPQCKTIIDIGGQDSKAILLGEKGRVIDFVMNDKCAAGTGRFLEVTAHILETTVDKLGALSADSREQLQINSTCVVFAESEIIGLIAQGKTGADIIAAVHRAIAKRTRNLIAQLHWTHPVVFTGGVAKNSGMQAAIAHQLGAELSIPRNSFITGALGAALFAGDAL